MFDVVTLDETHLDRMGIYRLNIGCRYYIGATRNSTDRVSHHIRSINNWIETRERDGKNSITKIGNYLEANKWITHGFFELLEEVEYEVALVDAEQKWFDSCFGDPNCLNFRMTAYRKVDGIAVRPLSL